MEPKSIEKGTSLNTSDILSEKLLLNHLTIVFGLLGAVAAFLGIVTAHFGINLMNNMNPGYRTIALSAALIWIFLGTALAYQTAKPLHRITGLVMQAILVLIATMEAVEFVFSIQGGHFFIETILVKVGTIIFGPTSSPISPVAAGLIVLAAIVLVIIIQDYGAPKKSRMIADAISVVGLAICLISFTFILSYFNGNPLLYGTQYIPIALLSALASFFTGVALVAAAGPGAFPVKYMIGKSTRVRLFRVFVPLVIGIILIQNFALFWLPFLFNINDAVLLSTTLVVFTVVTAYIVARVSERIGWALERAEQELVRKNQDLNAAYEEITSTEEELRQNFEELTRTELNLRESEHRLARAQEIAHLGSWELDLVNNRLIWTDEVYRIFGLRPQEFGATYEAFLEAIHPEDRSALDAAYSGSLREGRDTYEIEHRVIRKDTGEIRYIHEKCEHIRNETGKIIRSVGMIHDITERKKAETRIQNLLDEVRKEKDRLSSLINSISDEVWFADMQKNFTLANPVALKEFALGSGEIDVEKFAASLEVYHPDGSPRPVEEAPPLRALKGEEVRNLEEMIRTPGTGELRYRQVSSNPVRDASGSIVGSVSIVRDITELKKAEEELKQKNEDLNAANEELSSTQEELLQSFEELSMWEQELSKALAEKEVLLSEIHHRVKNNLTAFISLLSLDGSFEDTESGRTLRKDLQNRARSMALIHETLYRTGKFSNVDMEVYLKNLVNQITQSYEGGNNVHVFVEVHDATLDIARATTAGLIINELVTNSFKYAFPPGFDCMALRGEPGAIRVSFVHEDGIDVLRVSDNGCGLPAGLDPLATKSLGLKLVNFLASHQLQAEIAVRSDKGTEFIFRLNKREDEL